MHFMNFFQCLGNMHYIIIILFIIMFRFVCNMQIASLTNKHQFKIFYCISEPPYAEYCLKNHNMDERISLSCRN